MTSGVLSQVSCDKRPASICGGVMIRLDVSYFYRASLALDALRHIQDGQKLSDIWLNLYRVNDALRSVLAASVLTSTIRSSRAAGEYLSTGLLALMGANVGDVYTPAQRWDIIARLDQFDTVLRSELAVADVYIIADKPPFSTLDLISQGRTLFPEEVAWQVPDAVGDLDDAGRCLAFELPTACGFHIMRATEAVLRRYWDVVTGGKAHPNQRNMGVYLGEMEKGGHGDSKVLAALKQIKDLHRNPINHPGDTLTTEDAMSLIGVARGAVAAMLRAFPNVPELVLTAPEDEGALAPESGQ